MPRREREIDVDSLCSSMQHSRRMLERYRANRLKMVKQYVGHHWSEGGAKERVPVNLLALYVSVVGRNLIAKNPRVLLSTFHRKHKPVVAAMQSWCNREVERMHLAETLQRIVLDGLFSIGVAKVALATPSDAANLAWHLRAGQVFVSHVDLDDFVWDMKARAAEEVSYIGHRYRVPLDTVKDSKLYHKSRKNLKASDNPSYNEQGDLRIKQLGQGDAGAIEDEDFEDFVDLWEIYLPRHRAVITLPDDYLSGPVVDDTSLDKQPLREQDWLGPDTGPYHVLSYGTVPGNIMPKAPIQDLLDLHESTNKGYRKMMRTLDRLKELLLVPGNNVEEAQRITDGDDGDGIRVENADRIKQVAFSGQHLQTIIAGATVQKDLFSFLAGNLELLGGRGPQSKTATQDRMLNENAGAGVAEMQDRTLTFVARVMKATCWFWWNDPFKVMRTSAQAPGLPDIQEQQMIFPRGARSRRTGKPRGMARNAPFEALDVQVDPYSMQHQTPQSRMAALNQVVQTIILPMMPLLQQQGIGFDVNAYLEKVAAYMDMPDLSEIITIQAPPQQGGGGSGTGDKPQMPPNTERRYVRENVAQRTRQGDDQNLVNSMLGVKTGGDPRKNGKPMMA